MKKKYLILGLGRSGRAAAFFLLKQNEKIIAIDNNLIEDSEILHLQQLDVVIQKNNDIDFSKIKTLIISPGIDPNHEIIKKAKELNIEIIGEIELGCRYLKNQCIAITGTNGKTTLTKLVCHILNENNTKAVALGNVGVSLTKYLLRANKEDIIILELSSFQLETMSLKVFDLAVITNISPDHLDRYSSFEDYANAKLNILKCLKKDKTLYVNKNVLKTYLDQKNTIKIKEVKDDMQDIALEICLDLKIPKENILKALKTFKKVEHRLEFVREINDINFYNDSKATNVEAVIYAVNKINKPIILIVGGLDKGFSYKAWERAFSNKIKYILAIGQSATKIKLELKSFDVQIFKDLESCVKKAYCLAQKNDTVLFSPGCSSFDMFKNFEYRGEEFKKIVNGFEGEKCLEEIQ